MKPTIQIVFVLDLKRPWRTIRPWEAEIKSGPKMTWALFNASAGYSSGHWLFGKRMLLGRSAFFTFRDAGLAKIGRLRKERKKLEGLMRLPAYIAPGADMTLKKVVAQIEAFDKTGMVH